MALAEMIVELPAVAARLLERRGRTLADATDLLDEWACFLDPVRAARETAAVGCASFDGWSATAKANVTSTVIRAARDTAVDEAFIAVLAASPVLRRFVADGRLTERALPVVLGFGVLASLRLPLGTTGVQIRQKRREAQAVAAERRSASEASEQRPQLAPLGRSVPWAEDASPPPAPYEESG